MNPSPLPNQARVADVSLRGGRCGLLVVAVLLSTACNPADHTASHLSLELKPMGELLPPAGIEFLDPADLDAADGPLYVADDGAFSVYALTDRENGAAVFGKKGGGPLEFKQLDGIAAFPGGVAVTDSRNGRVTLLDTAGGIRSEIGGQGNLGAILVDHAGRIHLSRSHEVGNGGTVEVLDSTGATVGGYGKYETRTHAVANGLHNRAQLAANAGDGNGNNDDTGSWLLYTYRGLVQHYGSTFQLLGEWHIPLPDDFDNQAPYIKEFDTPAGMAVAIVRRPVATDIAVDQEGHVLIAVDHEGGDYTTSDLLAFTDDGTLLARVTLPLFAYRMAVRGDTLLVLDRQNEDGPRIGRFTLKWKETGS